MKRMRGVWVACLTVALMLAAGVGAQADPPTSECEIIGFTINGISGTKSDKNGLFFINVTLPYGTDAANLQPSIVLSPGADVNPASDTMQDFSNNKPVVYQVTPAPGIVGTPRTYVITVTIAASPNIPSGGSSMSGANTSGVILTGDSWQMPTTGGSSIPQIEPAATEAPRYTEPSAVQRLQYMRTSVTEENLLSFHIDDGAAKSALSKIKETAQEKRKEASDKEVVFIQEKNLSAEGVSISLDYSALDMLYSEGIHAVSLSTPILSITLNQRAMFSLLRAADGGSLIFTAKPIQTAAAETLLGAMPAFSLELLWINDDGETQPIEDLGEGAMDVDIPYAPREGENLRTLRALSLAEDGSTSFISGSYYAGDSVHLTLQGMQSIVLGSRASTN